MLLPAYGVASLQIAIVLEYVNGGSLGDILQKVRPDIGQPPVLSNAIPPAWLAGSHVQAQSPELLAIGGCRGYMPTFL